MFRKLLAIVFGADVHRRIRQLKTTVAILERDVDDVIARRKAN
jgi:hypothetical protein